MKKAILFVAALLLLSVLTNAQNKKETNGSSSGNSGKCYDENTRIINIGIGLPRNYYGYTRNSYAVYHNSPAFSISYEQPWKQRLGPGFLGVGALFGFQTSSYKYNYYDWGNDHYWYKHSYKNFMLTGRATYHWDGLVFEKGEVYGGVLIGIRIQTYNFTTNSPDPDVIHYRAYNNTYVGPAFGAFAGARYYFKPKFGVYAEVGYGISFLTGGISLKL
jgi:hypothetical protein